MKKEELPHKIAIFPLSNAVFFPKTMLPLNIFEDRYLQLVSDCMKEKKVFGMIQPKITSNKKPDVYSVGCLGEIVSFNETEDKRIIITLSGVTRFKIKEELNTKKLYREFNVDYSDFEEDLDNKIIKTKSDDDLLKRINIFFNKINYSVELDQLKKLNFDQLLSTVCMISPFTSEEKQRLIETIKIEDKVKILDRIINNNIFDLEENKTVQ
jgi:Lon protease-like protein|tara:strand:- start:58 stop:690 length:633 start_codon:yes stop_codon:yes gene_type:complete